MAYTDYATKAGIAQENTLNINVYLDDLHQSPNELERPMYTIYLYDVNDNNAILEKQFFTAAIVKANDIFNSFVQNEGDEFTEVNKTVRVIITRIPDLIFQNCRQYLKEHDELDYIQMTIDRKSPKITYSFRNTHINSSILDFINAIVDTYFDFAKEAKLFSKKRQITYAIKNSIIPLSLTGSTGKPMTVFDMAKKNEVTVFDLVKSLLTNYGGIFDEDLENITKMQASELRKLFLS